MGQIKILDRNMVNMIAAGEVIERPASVVKELMENSLDAGATRITVYVEDGGKNFISVTDNGGGMDADDLSNAFEPHATSKLKTIDDLMNISTMGFRGEALASIASVAKVAVTSRRSEQIEANKIEIDCGQKNAPRPCSGAVGTTIEVRNLFYKLPARRKFLRTANTEISHITEQFTRISLAHTDIEMTLIHNKKQLYRLSGDNRLSDRIAKLFTADIADSLLDLRTCEKSLELVALLGTPNNVRANSKLQYFFLNGRFIRDKVLAHALRQAYQGLTEPGRYPIAFIFLKMPPQSFDINVHPTKVEVRFDNSNLIYSQVYGILREKLLSIDSDVSVKLPPASGSHFSAAPESMASSESVPRFSAGQNFSSVPSGHFDFSRIKAQSDLLASDGRTGFFDKNPFENLSATRRYLQIHDSYIITQSEDGFIIIDQHALHERIIYEDLCSRLASDNSAALQSQKLLIPETFDPTPAQLVAFRKNKVMLGRIGIELDVFGPSTLAVQAFPTLLDKVNPVEFVMEALDILAESVGQVDTEQILHKILDMAACKAAVKAGQKLSNEEIGQLLADKDAIERAGRCPHGRPTVIKFTIAQLEKQFKRT